MNKIQIFNNPEFGDVRTVVIDGEVWFVGKDVAASLGYKNHNQSLKDNISEEDRRVSPVMTPSGTQNMVIINESGLYSLIFGSKLKSAKRFKKWVTGEILPSIRKTGSYGQRKSTQDQIFLLAQGAAELYKRVEGVEGRIEELENTMNLDHGQKYFLEKTVNKTVLSILGGKESSAYKHIGRKVFAECNGDLKAYFKVNARGNVPKKRYEEAITYAENWKPCTNTLMQIEMLNAQP